MRSFTFVKGNRVLGLAACLPLAFLVSSPYLQKSSTAAAPVTFVTRGVSAGGALGTPCVVFSVAGADHDSDGGEDPIQYQNVITNRGSGWLTNSTFLVPTTGVYYFSLNFVRSTERGGPGASEDVYMRLRRNANVVGYAWAGQTVDEDRMTGTYSVAIMLNAGDVIDTTAYSDGVPPNQYRRYLYKYEFTGFLLCDS